MDKRPLAVISVFFIIGIILGRFMPESVGLSDVFVVTLILIVISFILSMLDSRFRGNDKDEDISGDAGKIVHVFLFLSIISLGAFLYLNSNIFPPNHISHFLGRDKLKAEITGVIKSPAEARGIYYGKVRSRYAFETESIDNLKITGLALIRIQTEKDYQYGDRLLIKGVIKRPVGVDSRFRGNDKAGRGNDKNNGNDNKRFNYREYLERRNIFAIINASEKNVILLAHNYKVNPVLYYAYLVR